MSRVKTVVRFFGQLRLTPDLHLKVINAIQSQGGRLLQKDWCNPDDEGCPGVIAACAILGVPPSSYARSFSGTEKETRASAARLAATIGTSTNNLWIMISAWDELSTQQTRSVIRKLNRLRERLERKVIFSRPQVRDDQLAEMRALLADKSAESAPAKKEVIQVSAC